MKIDYVRGVLIGTPFLLVACTKVSPRWECHQRKCTDPALSASDLVLPIHQLDVGLELRIRRNSSGRTAYISVVQGEIPLLFEDPPQADVWILIGEEAPKMLLAHRMSGGQRLLLDDESTEWLISLIESETPFEIRLRRHSSEVTFHNLQKRLRKWNKLKV